MPVQKQKLSTLSVFGIVKPYSQFTKKVSTSILMVGLANGARKQQEIHSNLRHWKLDSHTNRISKSSI